MSNVGSLVQKTHHIFLMVESDLLDALSQRGDHIPHFVLYSSHGVLIGIRKELNYWPELLKLVLISKNNINNNKSHKNI